MKIEEIGKKKFHNHVMSSNFLLLKISFSPGGSQRVFFCLHDPLLPVLLECVVAGNIQTPSTEGIGNSWGVGGSQSPKNLSKCMKLDWNLRRGGRGGGAVLRKNPFHGGGMDNFWNLHLISIKAAEVPKT